MYVVGYLIIKVIIIAIASFLITCIFNLQTGKSKETDTAGIEAVAAVTAEARRVAETFSADKRYYQYVDAKFTLSLSLSLLQSRAEIERLCDEIDTMAAGLKALEARGEVTSVFFCFSFLGFCVFRDPARKLKH